MRRWQLVGAVTTWLLVSSCGGDDGAEAPATSWWFTTPPPPTRPFDTFPVEQYWPSDAPTTAVASTTSLAIGTGSAPTDLQGSLLAAVGATERAYDAALRDPEAPGAVDSIAATTVDGSPAEVEFTSSFRSHVSAGRVAVANPDVAPSVVVEGTPEIAVEGDWGAATVTVCHVDSDRLAMPSGADGELRLLNDGYVARRISQQFQLVGGVWLLAERTLIDEFPGATTCS